MGGNLPRLTKSKHCWNSIVTVVNEVPRKTLQEAILSAAATLKNVPYIRASRSRHETARARANSGQRLLVTVVAASRGSRSVQGMSVATNGRQKLLRDSSGGSGSL